MFLILHTPNSTASLGDKAVCGMLGWYVARSASLSLSLSLSLYASLAGFLVYLLEILGENINTSCNHNNSSFHWCCRRLIGEVAHCTIAEKAFSCRGSSFHWAEENWVQDPNVDNIVPLIRSVMDPKLQWTQNRKSITDNSKNFCQNFLWNFSILPAEKQTVVKNAFSTTDNWSPKDTLLLLILFNLKWYQDKLWKILENPVASDTCSHSSCDSLSSWTKRKEEAKNYNKSNVTFSPFYFCRVLLTYGMC